MKKVDQFIIFMLLIGVFFLRYIKVFYEQWYILDVFLLIYVFVNLVQINKKSLGMYLWYFISVCIFIFCVSLNVMEYGAGKVFSDNIMMALMPITLIIYFSYLNQKYSFDILLQTSRKVILFLNVYFWINTPIIVIQFLTENFMMGRFLSWGMYNFDHMTGFMGPFGTGILNVFWVSLLIGNILFYLITRNKKWFLMFVLEVPIMLLLSYFNENKAFIPTAILFIAVILGYVFLCNKITVKAVVKLLILGGIGVIIGLIMYEYIEIVKEQVDSLIEVALDFDTNAALNTHNERAYLNYLAFKYYHADGLGLGINNIDFKTQMIHKNLGINSFSLMLIQGGIWYYLVNLNIYALVAVGALKRKFDIQAVSLYITFIVIFAFLSFVTQPFRDHYTMFMVAILILFVALFVKNNSKTETGNTKIN
ncbi:hypothetical protein [Bacillus cereus]|mgnify:CR=1 FL=1|uniref:hypothetical protein n=1 Tax=Bacillus cereus TaxID=1396 RepID=UPI00292D607F|nr:hypothetical protein [Bacillus cereus]MDA2095097.1 hypothetical protein [Bacillus cereus]MDA2187761.1 hypothetical protein [Bacillus cereus]MDA2206953.1 hypothetical protein [Bacillus cereus]MDA2753554.1 hypothetical protein [Bacillus cereus]MEB9548282.1 hypothetical protein [Bacillus cereus]